MSERLKTQDCRNLVLNTLSVLNIDHLIVCSIVLLSEVKVT